MANKPTDEKEALLEKLEELYITGYRSAAKLYNATTRSEIGDLRTAKAYLRIIERRARNQWRRLDLQKVLRRDLQELQLGEKLLWREVSRATKPTDKSRIMDSILRIMERRAKLLGMDNENLIISQKPKLSIYQQMVANLPPENMESNATFSNR